MGSKADSLRYALKTVGVTLSAILLLTTCLLSVFPPNDSPSYQECVDYHLETQTTIATGGGIRLGNGLEITTTEVCDNWRTHTCQEWKNERNFLGRKYKHCSRYD